MAYRLIQKHEVVAEAETVYDFNSYLPEHLQFDETVADWGQDYSDRVQAALKLLGYDIWETL